MENGEIFPTPEPEAEVNQELTKVTESKPEQAPKSSRRRKKHGKNKDQVELELNDLGLLENEKYKLYMGDK